MSKVKQTANVLSVVAYTPPKLYVGVPGFEPGTPCSQSRCANRTALHPESFFIFSIALSLKSDAKVRLFFIYANI